MVLGAVFRETEIEGGKASSIVDESIASSPYYLVGWIGLFTCSSCRGWAVAGARDAVQAVYQRG